MPRICCTSSTRPGRLESPKGVVHTTGGYLTQVAATMQCVFDLREDDVYWCTADVGWVTGHSYIVYGPLANGTTVLMYEGGPDWPEKDRFWDLCEKYGVTVFYTAPTAIRAFMKWGEEWPEKHDLSKLRLLGSVGEPINPEAWMWYHRILGKERCPIVDTWWQTETGAIMITPLPAVTETRPGSATHPFPGISVALLDEDGNDVEAGFLAITEPWPSMLRTIYGDDERYRETYWSKWDGIYFAGDGAKRDDDGYLWLLGRVDDVLSVAGHRIGTMEVESALVDHPAVVEAAVVGKSHDVKGEVVAAFVTLKGGKEGDDDLVVELKQHVVEKIGAIARPETVIFTADLPKTRSGKIMRRLLKDVAEGKALGDTTTLADPAVVGAAEVSVRSRGGVEPSGSRPWVGQRGVRQRVECGGLPGPSWLVLDLSRRDTGVDSVGLGVLRRHGERAEHAALGESYSGHDRGMVGDPDAGLDDRHGGRDVAPLHDIVRMAVHVREVGDRGAVSEGYALRGHPVAHVDGPPRCLPPPDCSRTRA